MKKNNSMVPKTIIIAASGVLVIAVWAFLFDVRLTPSSRFLNVLYALRLKQAPLPEATAANLAASVIPEEGFTVPITWGDTGKKLVEAGGIDLEKYSGIYTDSAQKELLYFLTDTKNEGITINPQTAYFWVNTLWALGLTQTSAVLEDGIMGTEYKDDVGNFASTGGWTLGAKDGPELYSTADIIPLTAEQHQQVMRISEGIYRPCCGNSTAFPDCNHGMAILALVELMVSQGFSEEEIYQAALAFNSYWFADTYIDLAYHFQTNENTLWKDVDPKRVLSQEFSSGQGYAAIKQRIGTVPGTQQRGASCGA